MKMRHLSARGFDPRVNDVQVEVSPHAWEGVSFSAELDLFQDCAVEDIVVKLVAGANLIRVDLVNISGGFPLPYVNDHD